MAHRYSPVVQQTHALHIHKYTFLCNLIINQKTNMHQLTPHQHITQHNTEKCIRPTTLCICNTSRNGSGLLRSSPSVYFEFISESRRAACAICLSREIVQNGHRSPAPSPPRRSTTWHGRYIIYCGALGARSACDRSLGLLSQSRWRLRAHIYYYIYVCTYIYVNIIDHLSIIS